MVLGSVNLDHFVYVNEFPLPGETILAAGGSESLGGKGANQGVVSARLGASVYFIGQVGSDSAGTFVREQLDQAGISPKFLLTSAGEPTGSAYITVNSQGENTIAVVSGANVSMSAGEVSERVEVALREAKGRIGVGLAQGETSAATIETFAEHCTERGIRFVLNLAPVLSLSEAVLAEADPLIVNEGEARSLVQRFFDDEVDVTAVAKAADAALLLTRISPSVIITLGADGAVFSDGTARWHQAAPQPERIVDTTGAGDAFVGVTATVLAGGGTLEEAVHYGVAAGSLAVTGQGTTNSYPHVQHVLKQLETVEAAKQL